MGPLVYKVLRDKLHALIVFYLPNLCYYVIN
jgi:hypothetical protein